MGSDTRIDIGGDEGVVWVLLGMKKLTRSCGLRLRRMYKPVHSRLHVVVPVFHRS